MRYVLYHKDCIDGFGAAWAAQRILNKDGKPTKYVPTDGNVLPIDLHKEDEVFVLDLPFTEGTYEYIRSHCKRMVVIDYHSAPKFLEGKSYAHFDRQKSAARSTFEYFNEAEETCPTLIAYIDDYATEADQLNWAEDILRYIHSLRFTFEAYTKAASLLEDDFDYCARYGSEILDAIEYGN